MPTERDEDLLDWLAAQAAGLAHDVGNPLAGLSLSLELLEKTHTTAPQRRYLERARRACERLLECQGALLAASGGVDAPIGWHALAPLCERAAAIGPTWAPRLRVADGAKWAWGRAPVIEGALAQLLANAYAAKCDATVDIDAWPCRGGVAMRVADDGPGIASELGPRLFARRCSGSGRTPGLGLLQVAAAVVARHGGRVCACVGQIAGAVVQLWLPGPPAAAAVGDDRAPSDTFGQKRPPQSAD